MTAAFIEAFNSGLGVLGLLAVVLCGCVATYWITRRSLARELRAIRAELSDHAALKSAVAELKKAKSGEGAVAAKPAAVVEMPKPAIVPKPPAAQAAEEIAHETLVVIAAAVAAFVGKSVRLRSARLVQPDAGSPWAQQGRVFVQASHNLGQRAHA